MGGLFIDINMEKKYCVYVHIFPNGKRYFGITSKTPNARWENGSGYGISQPVVRNAIEKYGWENIEHIILFNNLSKEEAQRKETELIEEYKTNCKKYGDEYGYNMTDGGEGTSGHLVSDEAKRRISKSHIGKNKGKDNYKSKPVVCDNRKWETISDFCKENNLCRHTVEQWLYGENAMPIEWYNINLRFENETYNIRCQERPHKNIIYYDGKIFESQACFAKYVGQYASNVCHWIKSGKIPQKYLEKGFSINKPAND